MFSATSCRNEVGAMTEFLSHRGPDDWGMTDLVSDTQGYSGVFGHRRLSIIDLSSAGHQPMFSPSDKSCITYNGEIYNYESLKCELENEGVKFRSHCDTEVVLAGFERHGAAFLSRLRGMFAFAIWNSEQGKGYLVRDRFGIKPLYVTEQNGAVIFASEIRALLATGRVPRELSSSAVASYLATGSVAGPLTIIEGVYSVPAGCVIEVTRQGSDFVAAPPRRFASPCECDESMESVPARSHIHRIRNALRESVRYHLVSDVAVAVFLSGGIDSSAVAGLASEVSEKPIESFTVTFAETDYSEAAPAREAAKRFNTNHHEIPLSGEDLLGSLPDAFAAMDQPSLDGMNTFVVSRAVRSHGLKVVLSGLGGDELFGGYPSFHRARLLAPIWTVPGTVRHAGSSIARQINDPRIERIAAMLDDRSPARGVYLASRTLFGPRQVSRLVNFSRAGRFAFTPEVDDIDLSGMSLMQQVSLYELTGYMRNTLLRDSDVFSMAHGLELRVPFIDEQVARVAHYAVGSVSTPRGQSKPLLVEAVKDLLSDDNISRRKMGFTLPFERWMRNELFNEMRSVLDARETASIGLDHDEVKQVWSSFLEHRPGVNWSRPWALYTLIRWARENDVVWPERHSSVAGLEYAPALT
jgi:asparagine synthase (glutamine-hydrolysing)